MQLREIKVKIDQRIYVRLHGRKILRGIGLGQSIHEALVAHLKLDPEEYPFQVNVTPHPKQGDHGGPVNGNGGGTYVLRGRCHFTLCGRTFEFVADRPRTEIPRYCPEDRDSAERTRKSNIIVCPACNQQYPRVHGEYYRRTRHGVRWTRFCPACEAKRGTTRPVWGKAGATGASNP